MYYGITTIGTYAFYGTSALASVAIPASVTSVAVNAFCGYSSGDADNTTLTTVKFEATEEEISNIAGIDPAAIKTGSRVTNSAFAFEYGKKLKNVAVAVGSQSSAINDNKQNIRFAATVDSLGSEKVGYDVVVRYHDESGDRTMSASVETTTVYSQINAITDGVNTPRTAEECGGEYIYALTILGVPTNLGDIAFEITPYTITDGIKICGITKTAVYRNGNFVS